MASMTSGEKLIYGTGQGSGSLHSLACMLQVVTHWFVELLLIGQWYHNVLPRPLTYLNMTAQHVVERSTYVSHEGSHWVCCNAVNIPASRDVLSYGTQGG